MDKLEDGLKQWAPVAASSLGQAVAGLIVGFTASWKISLLTLAFIPPILISVACMWTIMSDATRRRSAAFDDVCFLVQQAFRNIRTVVAYAAESEELDKFRVKNSLLSRLEARLTACISVALGVVLFFGFSAYAVCVYYGGTLIADQLSDGVFCTPASDGCTTPGDVLRVVFSVLAAAIALGTLIPALSELNASGIASNRVAALIDKCTRECEGISVPVGSAVPPRTPSGIPQLHPARVSPAAIHPEPFAPSASVVVADAQQNATREVMSALPTAAAFSTKRPSSDGPVISLQRVHFAYPKRPDTPILHNADLAVPAGALVIIHGPSGTQRLCSSPSCQCVMLYVSTGTGGLQLHSLSMTDCRLRQELTISNSSGALREPGGSGESGRSCCASSLPFRHPQPHCIRVAGDSFERWYYL